MSRNLMDTACNFCRGTVVLDEEPRPITREEAGVYYELREGYSYAGGIFANAHCLTCNAKYLAWVDLSACPGYGKTSWCRHVSGRFFDLSFRHSFNDEPAVEDLPDFWIDTSPGLTDDDRRRPWPRCSTCGSKVRLFSAPLPHEVARMTVCGYGKCEKSVEARVR